MKDLEHVYQSLLLATFERNFGATLLGNELTALELWL